MDIINKRILENIKDNARISYVELGKLVGLSAPSVAERVQRMEENGVIKKYTADIHLAKLDYNVNALISLKIDSKGFKTFLQRLKDFPEIYECLKVTGEFCVILKVAVQNNEQLEDLIDRLTVFGHPNTSIILSDYSEHTCFKP